MKSPRSSRTVTAVDRLNVIKQALIGYHLDFIHSANQHLTITQIDAILEDAGYPNTKALGHTRDLLIKTVDESGRRIPIRPHVIRQPPMDIKEEPPASPPPDRTQAILNQASRTHNKRIKALAAKITVDLKKLRDLLDGEAERDKTRDEISRLEAELKAAKARLRGDTPPTSGDFSCDVCGRQFTTNQGRGAHRYRAHPDAIPAEAS